MGGDWRRDRDGGCRGRDCRDRRCNDERDRHDRRRRHQRPGPRSGRSRGWRLGHRRDHRLRDVLSQDRGHRRQRALRRPGPAGRELFGVGARLRPGRFSDAAGPARREPHRHGQRGRNARRGCRALPRQLLVFLAGGAARERFSRDRDAGQRHRRHHAHAGRLGGSDEGRLPALPPARQLRHARVSGDGPRSV